MPVSFKILISDDEYVDRVVLKSVLKLFTSKDPKLLNLYSSDNGIEGLGYLFLTKPDVIIIDSSLPGFSGAELAEYLDLNTKNIEEFASLQILILYAGDSAPEGFDKYISFSKRNPNFLNNLVNLLRINFRKIVTGNDLGPSEIKEVMQFTVWQKLSLRFGSKAILWSSKALGTISPGRKMYLLEKILRYSFWILQKAISRFYFLLFSLVTPSVQDENISQNNADTLRFRVEYYPSIFLGALALVITFILVFALIFGTSEIINVRDQLEAAILNKQKAPTQEVVNIFVKDRNGNLLDDVQVKVGLQQKLSDASGLATFKLESGKTYEITAVKGSIKYSSLLKVDETSLGYSSTVITLR